MLRTCCLLLLCIAGSRQLSITEFAVPSAVEAGKNAEFQCRYTETEPIDYIKWWWTPLYVPSDDRNRVLLYQRLQGQPAELARKNIEGKDNDAILLMDLEPTDSGIYECEVSGVAEVRKHQDLIVFSNATDMHLNTTTLVDEMYPDRSEEEVLVECAAAGASPQPELAIYVNGEEIVNLTQLVSGGEAGFYSVYANATVSKEELEDSEIHCELFFENRNITHPPYVVKLLYSSGAGWSTTEAAEDTTLSEMASELQNNGVSGLHACLWIVNVAVILQLYFHVIY
ncbi:V-set and immunoglobulin domain-containing protein 1-like isoform X2 [Ostrinia furnacalis]|uniref:V-set and immunoglobulin domain-containing protein 1-like isoform X1 n=1 Tax=Ostrinia furnacalis TaxID=93504 RepID=UPI00103EC97C|nr:V-set and immunoglobulin domain-containing protein 1-like isoform X1 [Ostrinia furnacalis]XP_028156015.1 V-set and immunoglobulin domain-containing protein 1-like isoform X2 [Ostrinia furnacalis]